MTREQLEQELAKRFGNSTPEFLAAATEIGDLLGVGSTEKAKAIFKNFTVDSGLVLWEKLALSDAASINRCIKELELK